MLLRNQSSMTNLLIISGVWGEWGEWTTCSQECGYGYKVRSRVQLVEANCGGKNCKGKGTQKRPCYGSKGKSCGKG